MVFQGGKILPQIFVLRIGSAVGVSASTCPQYLLLTLFKAHISLEPSISTQSVVQEDSINGVSIPPMPSDMVNKDQELRSEHTVYSMQQNPRLNKVIVETIF